jgi:nucleotide-binding universal stress UspA family protein
MTSLGTILLHVDASPRSAARVAFAHRLAMQLCANGSRPCVVNTLYAVTPSYLGQPFAFTEGAGSLLGVLQDLDEQRCNDARARLVQASGSASVAMHWQALRHENATVGTTRHALLADLVVLGQHDPGDAQTLGVPSDLIESVLIGSGKPGLVLPYVGSFDVAGSRVLLAWKPTRESAHALAASIPFLQGCLELHVVADTDTSDDLVGGGALAAYVRSHGVNAPIRQHAALPAHATGEGLLSLAADLNADLLVMGCYGHGRARELVLGGVTRTILRSMTLPVLMAH